MLNPGTVLQNRYEIIQRIGGGGMGDVYLAADLRLGNNRVVVKENTGGDPLLFQSEATILAALQHSNLPRVTDHFIEPTGAQYLVMDYIAGQNLEQIVQARGALPEPEVLAWFAQILDAVKYLHANRIIHRDIKPQNIIITSSGRAVLVDFGIAKVMQPGHATASGARGVGSPGYAPLEQYSRGTDERSDVYALGATLYFALTGIEPPPAPDRANGTGMASILQVNKTVSGNTENVVQTAMALQSNQRYHGAAEMQRTLCSAPPINMTRAPGAFPPKLLAIVVTIGILAIVLLISGGIVLGAFINLSTPTPTWTPTQALQVITVVITWTPQPPTATPARLTITPIPTLGPSTPTSTATRKPIVASTTATISPVALKYSAPKTIGPIYDLGLGRRDERHFPGDALVFEWQSVGPLSQNECYLIRVDFVPGRGDSFLQCDSGQAIQVPFGQTVRFILSQPNRPQPNYIALLPTNVGDTTVNWSVQVVRDDGSGNGPMTPDGIRHAVTPLSPKSNTVVFLLKGS